MIQYAEYQKKIEKILIDDNLDEFLACEHEFQFDYFKRLKIILKYNIGKIAKCKIVDTREFQYKHYDIILKNHLVNNKEQAILFIMSTFLDPTFSPFYFKRLINKFASYKLWELVDYLHLAGYRAYDSKLLTELYPSERKEELTEYGYNTQNVEADMSLKKMSLEKFIENIVDKKIKINNDIIDELCKYHRIDLLQHLITTRNCKLTAKQTSIFFGNMKQLYTNTRRRRRRMHDMAYKALRDDKYNEYCDFFRTNANNISLPKKRSSLIYCLKNQLYDQYKDTLQEISLKKRDINYLLNEFARRNSVDKIKYLIDHNIVQPAEIYKKTELVDDTLMHQCDKVYDYLTKELHMTYSKSLLEKRYWFRHTKYDPEFFNKLESLGASLKSIANLAILTGNTKIAQYVLDKGYKFTGTNLASTLAYGNVGLGKFLIKKGCNINKKTIISRLFANKNHRYYYPGEITESFLYYLIKNQHAVITNKNISHIVSQCDFKTLKYISENDKTIFDGVLLKDLDRLDEILFSDKFELITTINKNIIESATDQEKEQFLINYLENYPGIFFYLIKKFNFKMTTRSLDLYCDCQLYSMLTGQYFDKFMEIIDNEGLVLLDEHKEKIFSCCESSLIRDAICNKLNFKGSLKLLNTYITRGYDGEMVNYLIDKMGIKPSPYSVKILVDFDRQWVDLTLLEKMTQICGMMQETADKMKTYIFRDKKLAKKILDKTKIVDYEPVGDEMVRQNFYDDEGPVDELELAIQQGILERPEESDEHVDELEQAIQDGINDPDLSEDLEIIMVKTSREVKRRKRLTVVDDEDFV